jgi:hypothetical protein
MQHQYLNLCVYEALSPLTGVLCFWDAELQPGFDLGRALLDCNILRCARRYNQYLNLRCVRRRCLHDCVLSASGMLSCCFDGPRSADCNILQVLVDTT